MKFPSKECMIEEIGKVIELEGYEISVEVCRTLNFFVAEEPNPVNPSLPYYCMSRQGSGKEKLFHIYVVRTALEEEIKEGDKEEYRKLFKGAEQKKKFREAVEETIKANLYRNPSVIEELKAPQVHGGVGKKERKSSSKRSGKKGSPRKSAPRKKTDTGPKKPKKAQSGYILWTSTVRQQVAANNPGVGVGGLAKIFGKMWKEITDADRKKVDALVEKDKERFEKECEEFREKHGEDSLKTPKRKATRAAPRRKRPKDDDSFIRDEDATSTSSEDSTSSSSDSSDSDSGSSGSGSSESDSEEQSAQDKEKVKPPKAAFKPTPKSSLPTKPAAKLSAPTSSPKKQSSSSPTKGSPRAAPAPAPKTASPKKSSPAKAD